MNTAQWWPQNDPANHGALVIVLTYDDTTATVKKYDGTTFQVPVHELERRA